jgi:hypothetical protein
MHTATARAGSARRPAPARASFGGVLAGLAGLHAAMLLYDLQHPERFFNADRAQPRIEVIERFGALLRSGGDLSSFLASHGIAGDWLPHAVLFLAGGAPLVILAQVILALASVAWVREIGVRLGLRERFAGAAAVVYALLPHTLVFPHQLATEAIFVPLVAWSFVLVLRARPAGGGLAMGLASLVRPITIVWPLIHAACARRTGGWSRLAYVAAGLAPMALWVAFIHGQTGELSMGRSKHDLGHNLYNRVQRMAPEAAREAGLAPRAEPRVTVGEYARFVAGHPAAAAAHAGRDMMALGLKSGIERVVLDYLDLYPERRALQDPGSGWRKALEERGVAAALKEIDASLLAVSAIGAALFAILMVLALVGAWRFLATGRVMLVVFVLYVFATATAVDAAQSRHRAPAEFALCLLAAAGLAFLARRERRGR